MSRSIPTCGTRSAYARHKRNGETPCEPCVIAARAYQAAQKRRKLLASGIDLESMTPREILRSRRGIMLTPEQRFAAHTETNPETGCIEWIAWTDSGGYGRFSIGGRLVGTHRWSYEHHVGPIPEGLVLDHLCRNPRCANPDHLEPVTQEENVARGSSIPALNALKTHCKRGHEFTPENTRFQTNWNGRPGRHCRQCARDYKAALRAINIEGAA